MKTITLEEAIKLLQDAAAIILPDEAGNPLMYPSVDSDEALFLSISWTDEEGQEFAIDFIKGDNLNVSLADGYMHLVDIQGNTVAIQLLYPKTLE